MVLPFPDVVLLVEGFLSIGGIFPLLLVSVFLLFKLPTQDFFSLTSLMGAPGARLAFILLLREIGAGVCHPCQI